MPFDALFLTALSEELRPRAIGCRVDKVQQPARDTVILALRGPGGGGRLLLTAAPNQPRIQFTDVPQENPAQPPMFCMLLRKHLVGGKLAAITQPRMERLVDLAFDCTDEMGSPTQKHLILEIMGRNSNLILTDGEGRILDCLRRVDFEMSAERQVLPGLYYHQPPRQDKQEIFGQTPESVFALLQGWHEGQPFDKWLLDTFGGISPLVCREVTVQIFGALDAPYRPADGPLAGALADALDALERRAQAALPPFLPQLLGVMGVARHPGHLFGAAEDFRPFLRAQVGQQGDRVGPGPRRLQLQPPPRHLAVKGRFEPNRLDARLPAGRPVHHQAPDHRAFCFQHTEAPLRFVHRKSAARRGGGYSLSRP